MKKLIVFCLFVSFISSAVAQDEGGDFKNFRFGGTILPALYWYKPDDMNKFKSDGAVGRFGVLINGEYSFSGNFAIGFGVGIGSCGGKIDFSGKSGKDSAIYYFNDDKGIISVADTAGLNGEFEQYRLITRTYNSSYFILPVSLKMRTNEIGYMRYFFEPRFNLGIRKKIRANDNVVSLKTNQSSTREDLDITKDMAFLRMSATLSAGGEYYLSGSTAFIFAIGYDYGLSNIVQKDSEYLLRPDTGAVVQKFNQNGIILTLGFLF